MGLILVLVFGTLYLNVDLYWSYILQTSSTCFILGLEVSLKDDFYYTVVVHRVFENYTHSQYSAVFRTDFHRNCNVFHNFISTQGVYQYLKVKGNLSELPVVFPTDVTAAQYVAT